MSVASPPALKVDRPTRKEPAPDSDSLAASIRRRSRDLAWMLFGKFAMTGANSALMLLLAWLMEVGNYGLFGLAVGVQLLVSRMVLLGVDQGMIRLYTVEDLKDRPERVVQAGLRSTSLLSIPVGVAAVVLILVGVPDWPWFSLVAVALGSVGIALFDYAVCVRLARLHYRAAALVQASMPLGRLALTLGAFLIFPNNLESVFLIYAGSALLFGSVLSRNCAREAVDLPDRKLIFRLLNYSKWPGSCDIAMMACLQQGLFLLTYLGMESERGIYTFALTLSMGFFAIFLAFYQTILPRAVRLESAEELPRYMTKCVLAALLLVLASALVTVVIGLFLPGFLADIGKPELQGFALPFYGLAGFMMLLMVEAPLTVACQYLLLPQLALAGMSIRIVLVAAFGLFLAEDFGAAGTGAAQAAGAACSLVLYALLVHLAVRRRLRQAACAE
ncbi:MAG: hypothetical protein V2A76_16895 [Planctomycetota bacterium]